MPLLKNISVAGLTTGQVEALITDRLADITKGANVTVMVTQINSKKVYVLGAVKKEGPISCTYPMTIMQALSEAGGLTEYAKRKKIYVMRAQDGKEVCLPFECDTVVKGQPLRWP